MKLKKYTKESKDLFIGSQKLAKGRKHQAVEPEHLLAMLLLNETVCQFIEKVGGDLNKLKSLSDAQLSRMPRIMGSNYLSPRFVKMMGITETYPVKFKIPKIEPAYLLLTLADKSVGRGPVLAMLKEAGLTMESIQSDLDANAKTSDKESKDKSEETVLEQCSIDLVAKAREGKIGPVIGRTTELRRIIQILCRSLKNNPILIGQPGVGKTAIVEALAIRIASGDVPAQLKDCRLLTLDLNSLVAGASLRGEFEKRLQAVVKEVKDSNGQIILFVDEVHTIVSSSDSQDAAGLLKPALARGEIQIFGATTPDEFRNSIEKDKALDRRFQSILIEEPTSELTLSILRGIKGKFENTHGIKIQDPALNAAITLSKRYIPSRNLPDKAIDLIDEAASRLRIELDSVPTEIDHLQRHISHLKMELLALKDQNYESTDEHKEKLKRQIATAEADAEVLQERWESENQLIQKIRALDVQKTDTIRELEDCERTGKLEEASKIKFGVLSLIESEQVEANTELDKVRSKGCLLREEIQPEDIAAVVADITGIPISTMMESEREKLVRMEDEIGKRVIGQREALTAISTSVRRSRAGLNDPNRPVGSFFFLGPTGTGKCLAPETEVLCYDGNIVAAQDVKTGMTLMGPNSQPRKVLSTTTGISPMYRINPSHGDAWDCNDVHILTLRNSETSEIVDIPLDEYLKWDDVRKMVWKQYSTGADFEPIGDSVDSPYNLGKSPLISFDGRVNKIERNSMLKGLLSIRTASREERLEFLAGAIDNTGCLHDNCFSVVHDVPGMSSAITFVARSLGFKVSTRDVSGLIDAAISNIYGDISTIPTRVKINQASGEHEQVAACQTPFKVESLGEGKYAGFTLDGDGRFLLGDFTVTHNTELAKALTCFLFEEETNLIRLDMSEFMEKHTVARLIGAPPGYKGAEEGGQLTEAVRLKPYSVVLFDEVEKGHPDVFNVLLQILDDGRLTDSQGRLVDFKNTVIIMTSNVGSQHLLESTMEHGHVTEGAKDAAMSCMRDSFRPEFLGRIDEIVMFHGLTRENIEAIADIHLKKIDVLLAAKKLSMEFTPEAKVHIVDLGYQPAYGARPLRRALQKHLQDPLSMQILQNRFSPGDVILVDVEAGKLVFRVKDAG